MIDLVTSTKYYINMNTITAIKKNFNTEIKPLIMRAIHEVLSDPDFGLELTERAKRRLRKARISRQRRGIPFSDIKKNYY